MRRLKRVALETLGWVLLIAGVAAIFLPGPGLLGIFAGLALLSRQHEWAHRRLEPVRLRALREAAESVQAPLRMIWSVLVVAGLVGCGVLWILDPPAPSWWPAPESWWLPGGFWAGITLLVSAAITLGLLIYSYRRFHGKPEALAALTVTIEQADEEARDPHDSD
ncbi:hypothetical protein N802_13130 [Knoellia sinensis KCTC 19936]|uniref:Transmembrane protein (PGPGW) n=1 Tax=Knoellia sinensis KCTC 19936 TaxID=1385520 RepID=A0A0A0JA22_9MICO|nr:PGPGW domain-containing protein [Knoellia sinensis]KGN34295.1 hypothetical protein N802_13130 [Knoellia sinensis KCTC 19936]